MGFLVSLADVRDVFIIIYSVLGILAMLVFLAILVAMYFAFRSLRRTAGELIDESVKPTLGSLRATADSIKGTTEFVGQTAVSPIIRTYGMVAGVRRGLGVISGITRRKQG